VAKLPANFDGKEQYKHISCNFSLTAHKTLGRRKKKIESWISSFWHLLNSFSLKRHPLKSTKKTSGASLNAPRCSAAMPVLALQQDAEDVSDSDNSESRLQEIGPLCFG